MFSRNSKPKNTVAHNWANQLVSTYKKDTIAGSFYYEGKTIYSFGNHFPIAVIHEDKKRGNVTFFTTRSYSQTTSVHISCARSACSHHNIIMCTNPDEAANNSHNSNLEGFENAAKNAAQSLPKAKKPEIYLNAIAYQRELAAKYAAYFNIKLSAKKFPYLFIESKTGGNKASEAELKKQAKLKAEKETKQIKEFNEDLANFRGFKNSTGEPSENILDVYNPKDRNITYLRYNKKSKRIETSKGIEIPLEVGKRFYVWLLDINIHGGCDGKCTYKILHYTVNYVNDREFKVGCHLIQMSEAAAIAKLLKW